MTGWPKITTVSFNVVKVSLFLCAAFAGTYLFLRAGMYPAWRLWCHYSQGDPVCNSFWAWVVSLK